jgi:parallel beta-helix repeat protein
LWGKLEGGHWITIVGFDDAQKCWICKNSWGTYWGERGWFRIKYGECGIENHAIYLKGVYGNFPFIVVDDDNVDGPWDGSWEHPYQHIQDGIDNAFDGYTVYVCNGTYRENVIVNKSISLIGEDANEAIIDGCAEGSVISIYAKGVNISTFMIQNSGKEPYDAGIESRSSKTEIYGNNIQENNLGIYLHYPDHIVIIGNVIQNNAKGVYLWWSFYNLIYDNVIRNNLNGIELDVSWAAIIYNEIDNNSVAVYLDESNRNIVVINIIKNNDFGIELRNSDENEIFLNNFIDNCKNAYFFNSFFNFWNRNYWDDWHWRIPKPIFGQIKIGERSIKWVNFDWHPLNKPIEKECVEFKGIVE